MFWRHRKARERDLERELRSDLELEAEEQRENGLSSDEAGYEARRRLGNATRVKENVREMWGWTSLERFSQDLRYAIRTLRNAPGFCAAAVLTIALGIGANSAIFSLINAVLLHTLPVKDPRQLVLFGTAEGNFGGDFAQTGAWGAYSLPLYRQFKKQNLYFQDLCAFQSYTSRLSVRINGSPARVALGKVVSGNYFSVLGVSPYLGRTLQPKDDQPNSSEPAVVSYRAWVRLFARDATVIGHAIDVNGTSITIVGVTPPEFFGEKIENEPADFWMPLRLQPFTMLQSTFLEDPQMNWLNVIGRLKSGANVRKAQAHVTNILQQFLTNEESAHLTSETRRLISTCHVELTPAGRGISELRKRFSQPLDILMALVGLVLLTACANVANLLLARAAGRQTEIAMRLVLGAKRIRIIRQLLTESLVLAILGGSAGIVIAWWSTKFLVRLLAGSGQALPLDIAPDAAVLAFTVLISFAAMLLFGLAPALQSTEIDLAPSLKGSTNKAGTLSRLRISVAELLVIGQLGLSVLLMSAGGLLIRSFLNLEHQDLGFNPRHVLMVKFDSRLAGYGSNNIAALNREILKRVSDIPGVQSASLAKNSLFGTDIMGGDISVEGYAPRPGEEMTIRVNMVSPGYFKTEGMRILRGRGFSLKDADQKPAAAVINETMARRFFHNRNPIGKTFAFGSPQRIIGVVQDARYNSLNGKTPAMAFSLLTRFSASDLEVRTSGDPMAFASDVRRVFRQIDAAIPILTITTLKDQVDRSVTEERLVADLAGFFGLSSLVLAAVGLYGIISVSMKRRRREIGIRLAIGAERAGIVRMVLRRTFLLLTTGIGVGVSLGIWTNKLISSQLFGLQPDDPLTIFVSVGLLVVVGFCSAFFPARRASGMDPMIALRYE